MKVMINNIVYDANETPILLILENEDKININNMDKFANKFLAMPKNSTEQDSKDIFKAYRELSDE